MTATLAAGLVLGVVGLLCLWLAERALADESRDGRDNKTTAAAR